MTVTFDTSRLQTRLAALRDAVATSVAVRLPEAAVNALSASGYADPSDAESAGADPGSLVTEPSTEGSVVAVGIVQLYDWLIDPSAAHCFDPNGNDCPTFAANGPYTAEQMTARPGDGTTPCGSTCKCTWQARPLVLDDPTEAVAAAVGGDLAALWRST